MIATLNHWYRGDFVLLNTEVYAKVWYLSVPDSMCYVSAIFEQTDIRYRAHLCIYMTF